MKHASYTLQDFDAAKFKMAEPHSWFQGTEYGEWKRMHIASKIDVTAAGPAVGRGSEDYHASMFDRRI